jgi:hypothetical protein
MEGRGEVELEPRQGQPVLHRESLSQKKTTTTNKKTAPKKRKPQQQQRMR